MFTKSQSVIAFVLHEWQLKFQIALSDGSLIFGWHKFTLLSVIHGCMMTILLLEILSGKKMKLK